MAEHFIQVTGKGSVGISGYARQLNQYINELPGFRGQISQWGYSSAEGAVRIFHFSNATRGVIWSLLWWRKQKNIVILHDILPCSIIIRPFYWLFLRVIFSCSVGVIVHSETARDMLYEFFPGAARVNVQVIPQGLFVHCGQPGEKARIRRQYGFEEDDKVLFMLGMINKKRGQREFLKIFSSVGAENLKLVVAGNCTDALAAGIMEEHPRIRFFGFASEEEVHDLYLLCDAVVVYRKNSLGEHCSTISGALAHGKPALTSNYGAFREMMDDSGILFDNKPEVIREILEDVASGELDLEGMAERCRILRREFSWINYFHKLQLIAAS